MNISDADDRMLKNLLESNDTDNCSIRVSNDLYDV